MKLLHTVAFYYPRCGGAEKVVREISERLAARGHDVTVATTALAQRSRLVVNGVKIRQFDVRCALNHSVLAISGDVDGYLSFLRSENFDLVMNYSAQTWTTDLTCRVLHELECRRVLAPCGYSGLVGLRRLLYWSYFRRLPRYLCQYDAVIYHSEHYIDKKFGDAHGLRHSCVIPNGVDRSEFLGPLPDFRKLYGITAPYMLLCVGNHFINKGHDRVIAAFRRMNRPDTTLAIVGRNVAPWYRSCWSACARASGPRLVLVEGAPRSHVAAAYLAADVVLSGSYIEVFPLVIIESIASGTPFVAYPAGNIPELPGGTVVTSEGAMAEAVNGLLDDRSLRERLGSAGVRHAAKYDWEVVVDQYEKLYRDLVDSRAGLL